MLYIFHGSDITKGVEKSHALIASLRTKRPDAAFESISAENWSLSIVEGHLGGQGLFSGKYIVFLDRVTESQYETDEVRNQLVEFLAVMQESPNIFIILEGKVNAELKKVFDKHAEKVVTSDLPATDKWAFEKKFNIFSLADAVGNRESFKAWSIYRQAIDNGIEVESIAGTLFWQVKSMMLASNASSATEAGLNPFVFGKTKKAASNYSSQEMQDLLGKIITIYHDGHRGMNNLELAFEKLLLGK